MQKIIKTGEGILLGLFVLLLFLVIFQSRIHEPGWLMVAGRMHPLFLHFPIVLLLLALLLFWLPVKEVNEFPKTLRLIAALSATLTALMGLLLSLQTESEGSLLQWHEWMGIGVAVLGTAWYVFYTRFAAQKTAGKIYTIASAVVIILAGHFGGQITHGTNYLWEPVQNTAIAKVSFDEARVFDDVIRPVFMSKCGSCHGNGISKGGLTLSDSAGILRGGKTGPLLIAGNPEASLLLTRIHLPDDEKKHMPPISKSQLNPAEIALLTAWIKSGGLLNHQLAKLPAEDSFRILAASRFTSTTVSNDPVYNFPAADEKKIKALNNNYRVLEPLSVGSPALAVYFYGKAMYSEKALEELAPVKQQVIALSLARMPVKDEAFKMINQFTHLEKLNLNYTDITAQGLQQLNGLTELQEISLSGTAVTAAAVEKIALLPKLRLLVIWDTKIDTMQVAALQKKFRKIKIENGFVDDGKFIAKLSPPMIQSASGVFDTMRIIKMKHPFRGVSIRYTLDGTKPDSTTSTLYKDSFAITGSARLKVRAFRQGWVGSDSTEALYLKRGFIPDSVELATPPDPKYKSDGKIVIDKELGDLNSGSGKWLGYMNNPAVIHLYFNKAVTIHSVLVNLLKRNDQVIFLPDRLEVWGGADKSHLVLLGQINAQVTAKPEPGAMVQQTISFSAVPVKFIKIVATPIRTLPKWYTGKSKKGWAFLNEVVVN